MPGKIINSTQSTIADSTLDLSLKKGTLKKLDCRSAGHHLATLGMALVVLEKLIKEKLPEPESRDVCLHQYLRKIAAMQNLLAVKDKVDSLTEGEMKSDCAIHPTDSGFPLFIRDLEYLRSDKEAAAQNRAVLPPDDALVDGALFSLFRGQYPREIINKKHARNYWAGLMEAELPVMLKVLDEIIIARKESATLYGKSVERLDDTNNLPLLYTMYFRVPQAFVEAEWRIRLYEAIRSGMGIALSIEMPYLARLIEDVEGVMLDMIERYTIGPFYSAYTANTGPVAGLIQQDDDFIMMFHKCTVVRVAERGREGFSGIMSGIFTGDNRVGEFAPPLDSPRFVLMPYRMVQKAHNMNISLGDNVKMYGFTKEGGIID